MQVKIDSENIGIRIDKFFSSLLNDLSRNQIQDLILAGQVTCNNQVILNPANKTKEAIYEINLDYIKPKPNNLAAYDFPLEIIFEDEYLLIINKPPYLTVHPGAGNYDKTLANALIAYSDNLSKYGGEFRPGIVHRLDKDTSGLLIVAKDDTTHQLLSEALSLREIKRYYLALVFSSPTLKAATIKANLVKHKHDHTKMVICKTNGKEAITHYNLIETYLNGKFSLLECKLDTGRTHQIRAHLNYKELPIVGDPIYKDILKYFNKLSPELKKVINSFKRQALHAYKLEFIHPITEELMQFEIDLPEDIQNLIYNIQEHS